MKKRIHTYYKILIVLGIAIVLRFWQLGAVPISPNWDETALGYNAYSIARTGRDEYGTFLPLSIRSFDDYKPPLYVYLTVPSVALFGLSPWSTRLPAAIVGVLAVCGTYVLTKKILSYSQLAEKSVENISLLSALLLAISPWHLQFSRAAFEAGIGISINIWAVYFFLRGLKQNRFWYVSAFLFALSLYAYHSQRIFAPLLLGLLLWTFWKEVWKHSKKQTVMAICVGIITVTPLVPVFLSPTTFTRLRGTSAIADETLLLAPSVQKLEVAQKTHDIIGEIANNRRIIFAKTILDGYLRHFSLGWLFIRGDNARHHAPAFALMYLVELPFLLYGLYVTTRTGGKVSKVVLGWILISPIAASPTTELPHAIRTLVVLPMLQIVVAMGIYRAWQVIGKRSTPVKYSAVGLFAITWIFMIANYLDLYFIHQNIEFSQFWQYGYKDAVGYTQEYRSVYKKIVVSTKLEQPHMFFLFFLKYDPEKYLAEGGTSSGGFAEVKNRFDIYEFRPIHWENENKDGTTLFIGSSSEIPTGNKKTIRYQNGTVAMQIADR